jgi:uncharacterized protein (TIGR03437 family)
VLKAILWLGAGVFCGALWGAAPSYEAAGILNVADLSPGPFAPNTVVALFGTDLAWSTQAITAEDVRAGLLPTALNGVQVFVSGWPAPLYLISPSQINFLMPPNQVAGQVKIRVVRQGVNGPNVVVTIKDAAPGLFPNPDAQGYAIAQRWPGYSLNAPGTPSDPGGIVILYATGMGITENFPSRPDEIPQRAGTFDPRRDFRVFLNGDPLSGDMVLYAGLCPGFAGLYQINLRLPDDTPRDPEIRVGIDGVTSPAGLKLAVSGSAARAIRARRTLR